MGRKHGRKRRKCWLPAFSPIPTMSSKGFFFRFVNGGYLDFSHLTELKSIIITEIYIRKQYKSSKIKNKTITKKIYLMGVPLKGYVAS